ncbi:MAG: MaoC/PaaZ C-terminal domain-containing protein [Gammaproteobacteria bacterium]|nr:MaoC/PaaZ C-terminal domain-containing protein [Gammaproteobacteria bacterium]
MNLDALRAHEFEPMIASYSDHDVMLYALSLGVCDDPLDENELPFVYEKNLRVLPSITAVLANKGGWITDKKFDVNFVQLLHGEQRAQYVKPLPPSGELSAEYRVSAVVDKGEGKGTLVYIDKILSDNATGDHLCTVTSTLFLRADGGCGSFGEAPAELVKVPESSPDFVEELTTSQRAALLYRLNGDRNPLHADPEIATKAGFEAPILHGLCTYGICGFSILRNALDYDITRLKTLDLRFSSPVLPGETLQVEGWEVDSGIAFQAKVKERDKLVISNGLAATV